MTSPRSAAAAMIVALLLLGACGDDATSSAADDTTLRTESAPSADTAETTSTSASAVDVDGELDYDFTIPAGTGERIDAGEQVEVIPQRMDVTTGETIRIVNEDDRAHIIGPFYVPANDTMEHTFVTPGEFSGTCTAHQSGQITVVVTEA